MHLIEFTVDGFDRLQGISMLVICFANRPRLVEQKKKVNYGFRT